jgi:hypothetical protein
MRTLIPILIMTLLAGSCEKRCVEPPTACDIQKARMDNSAKVTITMGIWGTVSFMEGNCMPIVDPASTTCKHCPVKRTMRVYAYTNKAQASASGYGGFYDSFSTQLIKEVETDANGFFQAALPSGQYTLVVVENGKLYANSMDAQGGLNPFTIENSTKELNLVMTYKAAF